MASGIAQNIRLKRVYEPPADEDGWRVLSMRYWPRGIARTAVDEYTTKTAPSRELLHEFLLEGLAWEPYVRRYVMEMEGEQAKQEIERLAQVAKTRTVTLMCGCEDENRCHRSLLRNLTIASVPRDSTSTRLRVGSKL